MARRVGLLLMSGLIVLSGCFLFRKSRRAAKAPALPMAVLARINERNADLKTLQQRFRVQMEAGGQQQTFTLLVRYLRDSALWVSVQGPMGIEVARGLLLGDSFIVVSRLEHTVYKGTTKMATRWGVPDVYWLADVLLLGNVPVQGQMNLQNDTLWIRDSLQQYPIMMAIALQDTTLRVIKTTVEGQPVVWRIVEYQKKGQFLLPARIEVEQSAQRIALRTVSLKVNDKLGLPFRVPKKYRVVEVR